MKMNITFEAQTVKEEKILCGLVKKALDPKTALGQWVSTSKAKVTTSAPKKRRTR